MIVKAFSAENLLTYSTFEMRLDGLHCTILGPNGGGKSQVVRLLDLVQKGLDSVGAGSRGQRFAEAARQTLQSYADARHYGESRFRPSVVRLEVAFTTPLERLWILTYLRAAVLNSVLQEFAGNQSVFSTLAQWVEEQITAERIAPLFTGTIVLRHASLPHVPWDISYEFTHNETRYAWVLSTHVSNVIIRASEIVPGFRSIPQERLVGKLFGINGFDTSDPLKDAELGSFNFGMLCPDPGNAIAAPVILVGAGIFDAEYQPFRAAITTIGVPAQVQGQSVFSFGYVLSALLSDGVIVIGEQLRGLGTGGAPPQYAGPYSWEALASPVRGHAPWELPLRLFELKNGTPADKARFERVKSFFTTLAPGRTLDVTFQAVGLSGIGATPMGAGQTAILGRGDTSEASEFQSGAVVTVTVDRVGDGDLHPRALPIQLQGAGTWEALVLAEALAEAPDRLLVLDEPAVTLHPSWQRALRSKLKAVGGQVLLITHSADLVSMEDGADLGRLVRLENETGQSRVHRFDVSGLETAEVSKITRDFALSTDAVSLLFARGVVLVEGETELGALPKWFAESSHGLPTPAELDLAFWSVGSDTHFQPYITVLNALAIPWALVCDGAAFDVQKRQKRKLHIFSQVLNSEVDAPDLAEFMACFERQQRKRDMEQKLFDEERLLGKKHGVHTLALGWTLGDKQAGTANNESFEAFIESIMPGKLALAEDEVGDSKVRSGRWIADNVACPAQIGALYNDIVASLKERGLSY